MYQGIAIYPAKFVRVCYCIALAVLSACASKPSKPEPRLVPRNSLGLFGQSRIQTFHEFNPVRPHVPLNQ
jgi:hypothetical protein